jgi:hypothetical protein
VQTDDLLTRVREAPLDARLGAWLRRTAASWNDALPTDSSAIASFVYDIVPALAGATIREIPTAA